MLIMVVGTEGTESAHLSPRPVHVHHAAVVIDGGRSVPGCRWARPIADGSTWRQAGGRRQAPPRVRTAHNASMLLPLVDDVLPGWLALCLFKEERRRGSVGLWGLVSRRGVRRTRDWGLKP